MNEWESGRGQGPLGRRLAPRPKSLRHLILLLAAVTEL